MNFDDQDEDLLEIYELLHQKLEEDPNLIDHRSRGLLQSDFVRGEKAMTREQINMLILKPTLENLKSQNANN